MAAISYSDMLKPSRRCIRYFKHTENVFGVIPSPFEDHITVLFEIADDVRFEFILRNTKQFNIKNNHIKIYRINFDPELAFIVTDSFIGITFPLMTGEFDTSRILVSESKKAIKFGKDLFEFYKAHSTRV
jgi:predicted transcriptional regulator